MKRKKLETNEFNIIEDQSQIKGGHERTRIRSRVKNDDGSRSKAVSRIRT